MQWDWNITYEMEFKWFALIPITAFIVMGVAAFAPSEKEKAQQERWDNCVVSVNKAIPDPNDTEARSALLKTCYESYYEK